MDRATRIISVLERDIASKESDIYNLINQRTFLKNTLTDAIQLISDLLDPDCPEDYRDVADAELSRIIEDLFKIN